MIPVIRFFIFFTGWVAYFVWDVDYAFSYGVKASAVFKLY